MIYLGKNNSNKIEKSIKEFKERIGKISNEELSDIYESTSNKYKNYKMLSITEEIIINMKMELEAMEFEMKKRKLKKPSFFTIYKSKELKARWYQQLKEKTIEHLDELEQKLEKISKNLEYENIGKNYDYLNKNYDYLRSEINTFMIEINFIEETWKPYSYERILKKVRYLKNVISDLFKKIHKIGSTSRKEIFVKLEELKSSLNDGEIREILRWIWDKIGLREIEYQKIYSLNKNSEYNQGLNINSNVYESQIVDFNICLHYSMFNDMYNAILSLDNFIAPYSYSLDEPFNIFEKLCIRTMIENIVKNVDKKNNGGYYTQYESVF